MSYIFYDVIVGNEIRAEYTVAVEGIKYCSRTGVPRNKYICHYYLRAYDQSVDIYAKEKLPDFEAMFPIFPYDNKKFKKIKEEQVRLKIEKLENDIVKLLSHVEAIMTILGERLPTDDLMKL